VHASAQGGNGNQRRSPENTQRVQDIIEWLEKAHKLEAKLLWDRGVLLVCPPGKQPFKSLVFNTTEERRTIIPGQINEPQPSLP
jgi:hypothetical protein